MQNTTSMKFKSIFSKKFLVFLFTALFLSAPIYGQMIGTYTINPTGTGPLNFTSVGSAITSLINNGISGPVVFNINQGIYSGQLTLPAISGSTTTNTITFQSNPTNTSPVVISHSATFYNWVWKFNGTNNIIIKNLTIQATNNYYGNIIQLEGTNSNISFIGNNFIGTAQINDWAEDNTAIGLSSISSNTIGNWKFIDNTFSNICVALSIRGQNQSVSIDTCTIYNNTVNAIDIGLRVKYAKYVEVRNNELIGTNPIQSLFSNNADDVTKKLTVTDNKFLNCFRPFSTSTTLPGGSTPPSVVINSNEAESNSYGFSVISADLSDSLTQIGDLEIKNNRIKIQGPFEQNGLYISGVKCSGINPGKIYNNIITIVHTVMAYPSNVILNHNSNLNFYHNSLSVCGLFDPGGSPYSNLNISHTPNSTNFTSNSIRIYNNIFHHMGGGYAIFTYINAIPTFRANYNLYYTNGWAPFELNSINFWGTFANWQSTTMQDSNSIWADPNFIDSTNLHILNSPAQNAGKPISTVSNDIDGDLRSLVSPDIGADEYSPNQYHVSVDMRLENINPNGVHIVGNFQGWNTDSTLMEDSDGDGIYTYTIDTYFGDTVMYRFINGDEWSNAEVVPIGCQFLGSSNRGKISNLDIDSAQVVCFSACISCNVGISEHHSINLYPNPSHGAFVIERTKQYDQLEVFIVNSTGEVVQYLTWPSGEPSVLISLDILPAGVYSVHLKNAQTITVLSVVIQP